MLRVEMRVWIKSILNVPNQIRLHNKGHRKSMPKTLNILISELTKKYMNYLIPIAAIRK